MAAPARTRLTTEPATNRGGHKTTAQEPLREALSLAARCGADGLAIRVRDELIATGARPRRPQRTGPQSLTASELRVARLAAAGPSNRDIAQALFDSRRTVEIHLTNAYRKLNIETRNQLSDAINTDGSASSELDRGDAMRSPTRPTPRRFLRRLLLGAAAGTLMAATGAAPAQAIWLPAALMPVQLQSLSPAHLTECIVPDLTNRPPTITLEPCAFRSVPDEQKWLAVNGPGISQLRNEATDTCIRFNIPPVMNTCSSLNQVWEYNDINQHITGSVPSTACLLAAANASFKQVGLGACDPLSPHQKWSQVTAR